MKILEVDLSEPVSQWLMARGFTPYAEVPFPSDSARQIDLVGRSDGALIAVELKRTLTQSVIQQTYICDLITDLRYAAVGTRPRSSGIEHCRKVGIGLLSVVNGTVSEVLAPRENQHETDIFRERYARTIRETLDRMTPNGKGGLPCLKGEGPAQDCFARVAEFRKAHSRATWKVIFANVPNHYSSAGNLYSGMRFVEKRRAEAARQNSTTKLPEIADELRQQAGRIAQ